MASLCIAELGSCNVAVPVAPTKLAAIAPVEHGVYVSIPSHLIAILADPHSYENADHWDGLKTFLISNS